MRLNDNKTSNLNNIRDSKKTGTIQNLKHKTIETKNWLFNEQARTHESPGAGIRRWRDILLLLMETFKIKVIMIHNSCTGFKLSDENEVSGKIRAQSPQLQLQQALYIIPRKTTILPQKFEQAPQSCIEYLSG
jgi:hypothetical protein